ncbi:hypothetical protein Tco_0701000, partial [Tanacetum coccineum]
MDSKGGEGRWGRVLIAEKTGCSLGSVSAEDQDASQYLGGSGSEDERLLPVTGAGSGMDNTSIE